MKKKIMLGSVLITLLMLVSTQTIFMENVMSWPSEHTGDAFAGNMWVSELNTTSILTNVKNVSIAHANATHDWVKWTAGIGTIKADWSVDIGNRHPVYWISFALLIYNIDDNSNEIGNATFMKTYNANTSYNESGTLQVLVEFPPSFLASNNNATLLCYIDTVVVLNDTSEAVNFTSWAVDRCVVGVSLDATESSEPFSRFTTEANEEWPHMWAWIKGWNESSRFADEEDMLNNQTCFLTGTHDPSSNQGDWDLGNFEVTLNQPLELDFDDGQYTFNVGSPSGIFYISCHVDVTITSGNSARKWALVRYQLWKENVQPAWNPIHRPGIFFIGGSEAYYQTIAARQSDDIGGDPGIEMAGLIWGVTWHAYHNPLRIPQDWQKDYVIKFTGDNHQGTSSSEGTHYWEGSCVYQNHSFDIDVTSSTSSGITTVVGNITGVLQSSNETIYTYAGDRGNTRVEFTI